ncbi:MAG TPA: MBL fold metallo-hydrolase [Smithellaceae bacterium]|nr:MBL fold metallo-hydrolase [Smithellaceae bacterium]HRS89670.1 MBL fold metallo-hydrolase [Smithellaceae bacterium]HRV25223.1 MBL fold metallo-hydrolase [Smithellaceae bacterium]
MKKITVITLIVLCMVLPVQAEEKIFTDKIKTAQGDLAINILGHASLMMSHGGKLIYIDPFSQVADYAKMPKADLILITHDHMDHLDLKAVDNIKTPRTTIVGTQEVAKKLSGVIVMKNGDTRDVAGLKIEAVPAYNLVHMRAPGVPFHPNGVGNGYVINFADKRVYIAGDTENTPEMKKLPDIDVAFLPMNLPYTMTPEMVADAARAFRPKILYPYHYRFGQTDMPKLKQLLQGEKGIDLRIPK